jgi:nicotinate phosphoribosyltransferase
MNDSSNPSPSPGRSALLTDLYQLTMLGGYHREGKWRQQAVFEYSFRSLPPDAGFAVFAGLEPLLEYWTHLRFSEEDLEYLRTLNLFEEDFLAVLRDFKPSCTVKAPLEGTIVFPNTPLIEIQGPLGEVQLYETVLLNLINYQTLIATKAARICLAAEGDPVLEFGLRRAQGPDGGLGGSRAAHIGGCDATSNVLAGKTYDIPLSGTHAHSWVMSFPSELEAFQAYARTYPDRCTLLVDTYDTLATGVPNAIQVFREMRDRGYEFRPAIRLDSGDLAKLSKGAYRQLREAGFADPLIIASGDLEEDLIADLKRQGAKINAWGVGTHLITSRDSPSLNGVYKLMAVEREGNWEPRIKVSSNIAKTTDPGRKQAIRYYDAAGSPLADVLYRHDEAPRTGEVLEFRNRMVTNQEIQVRGIRDSEPLLKEVVREGRRILEPEPIHSLRDRARRQVGSLSEEYKRLRNLEIYKVLLSPALAELKEELLRKHAG